MRFPHGTRKFGINKLRISVPGIKVVQINLHHSEVVSDEPLRVMAKKYRCGSHTGTWRNEVRERISRHLTLITRRQKVRFVACRNINITLIFLYSDEGLTVVALKCKDKHMLIFASMYHDLIIGGDANAHHIIWSRTDINKRGEYHFQ